MRRQFARCVRVLTIAAFSLAGGVAGCSGGGSQTAMPSRPAPSPSISAPGILEDAHATLIVPQTSGGKTTTPTPETTVESAAFVPGSGPASDTYQTLDVYDLDSGSYVASVPTLIPNNRSYFVRRVLTSPNGATCYEVAQSGSSSGTWLVNQTVFPTASPEAMARPKRKPADLLPIVTPTLIGPFSGNVIDAATLGNGVILVLVSDPANPSQLISLEQINGANKTILPTNFGPDYADAVQADTATSNYAVIGRSSGATSIVDSSGNIVETFPEPTPSPSPAPYVAFIRAGNQGLTTSGSVSGAFGSRESDASGSFTLSPAVQFQSLTGGSPIVQLVPTTTYGAPIINHEGTILYDIGNPSTSTTSPTVTLIAINLATLAVTSTPVNVPNMTPIPTINGQFGITFDDSEIVIPATIGNPESPSYSPAGGVLLYDAKTLAYKGSITQTNTAYANGLVTR